MARQAYTITIETLTLLLGEGGRLGAEMDADLTGSDHQAAV